MSYLEFTGSIPTVNVLFNIMQDTTIEPTESFSIVLSNPQPAGVLLGISTVTVYIIDDDIRE